MPIGTFGAVGLRKDLQGLFAEELIFLSTLALTGFDNHGTGSEACGAPGIEVVVEVSLLIGFSRTWGMCFRRRKPFQPEYSLVEMV